MARIMIEAEREVYGAEDVRRTMTVGELIAFLEQFEEDTPVILSHDNGYTFGGIKEENIREDFEDEESEEG